MRKYSLIISVIRFLEVNATQVHRIKDVSENEKGKLVSPFKRERKIDKINEKKKLIPQIVESLPVY